MDVTEISPYAYEERQQPAVAWQSIGVPMSDKSVPAEARDYLQSRGWCADTIERANMRLVDSRFILENWRRASVRDDWTAQHEAEEAKKVKARNFKPDPARWQPKYGIVMPIGKDFGVVRVFYEITKEGKEKPNKFLTPFGMGAHVHVPTGLGKVALRGGRAGTPADKLEPLVIVESYFKSEVAATFGIACVGIGGCHMWRVDGAIHPDILALCAPGRRVILLTDGDAETNLNVREAVLKFFEAAKAAGLVPLARPLPPKMGIDDFLASGKSKADYEALPVVGADSPLIRRWSAAFLPLTELGLGDRFVAHHGHNTFYDHQADEWYSHVDGQGWQVGLKIPNERMQQVVRSLDDELAAEKHPLKILSRARYKETAERQPTRTNAMKQAIDSGKIGINSADFDADPDLLGCKNGVLRLSTRELLPPSPQLKVSMSCAVAYDPSAKTPLFTSVIKRALNNKRGLLNLLQEIGGACLLGRSIRNEVIFLVGDAFTAKSVVLEAFLDVLGDYGVSTKADIILKSNQDSSADAPSPYRMSLRGKRLVTASELPKNKVIDDAAIKDLTGGDTIPARALYKNEVVSFRNTARILIRANHPPSVASADEAVWSRLMLMPFDVVIPENERDSNLREKIKAEGAGILNWMIVGLQRYAARGYRFEVPDVVKEQLAAHRRRNDWLSEWAQECLQPLPHQIGDPEPEADFTTLVAYWTDQKTKEIQPEVTDSILHWRQKNGYPLMLSKTIWSEIRHRLGGSDPIKMGDKAKYAHGFCFRRDELGKKLNDMNDEMIVGLTKQVKQLEKQLAEAQRAAAAAEVPLTELPHLKVKNIH